MGQLFFWFFGALAVCPMLGVVDIDRRLKLGLYMHPTSAAFHDPPGGGGGGGGGEGEDPTILPRLQRLPDVRWWPSRPAPLAHPP